MVLFVPMYQLPVKFAFVPVMASVPAPIWEMEPAPLMYPGIVTLVFTLKIRFPLSIREAGEPREP